MDYKESTHVFRLQKMKVLDRFKVLDDNQISADKSVFLLQLSLQNTQPVNLIKPNANHPPYQVYFRKVRCH